MLVVMKFGGTSVADAERIKRAARRIVAAKEDGKSVVAVPGETVITLHAIPPGTYAIQTFQDVNANDKMDTTWLGLPLEPFGFSQDAKPFLSKPGFDAVKFTLVAGDNSQIIHLQNMGNNSASNRARDAIRARQRQ